MYQHAPRMPASGGRTQGKLSGLRVPGIRSILAARLVRHPVTTMAASSLDAHSALKPEYSANSLWLGALKRRPIWKYYGPSSCLITGAPKSQRLVSQALGRLVAEIGSIGLFLHLLQDDFRRHGFSLDDFHADML